jgi:hypothetical protein
MLTINVVQKLRLSLGSRLGSPTFYEPSASGYRVQEPRLNILRLEDWSIVSKLRLKAQFIYHEEPVTKISRNWNYN